MALKFALRLVSPGGAQGRLSVFIFHRVLRAQDPLFPGEPDEALFDSICAWITRYFKVLPLSQARRLLVRGELPARAAAITFDDGYADNWTLATPILQRHQLVATFFIATGFLDGGRMWNDTVIEALRATQRSELDLRFMAIPGIGIQPVHSLGARKLLLPRLLQGLKHLEFHRRTQLVLELAEQAGGVLPQGLMMTSQQVQQLHHSGMEIGAHTVNHPILAGLDDASAWQEMVQSKQMLETLLRTPVTQFAYPNGRPGQDFLPRDVELAQRAGFDTAVTTAWGAAKRSTDPYQIPRFTPWDRSALKFGLRMTQNLMRHAA